MAGKGSTLLHLNHHFLPAVLQMTNILAGMMESKSILTLKFPVAKSVEQQFELDCDKGERDLGGRERKGNLEKVKVHT